MEKARENLLKGKNIIREAEEECVHKSALSALETVTVTNIQELLSTVNQAMDKAFDAKGREKKNLELFSNVL